MNTTFLIGLVAGAIVVAVYYKANQAVKSTADRIDRRVLRTLPGFCQDCSGSSLDHRGLCATCGSNAIWCPTSDIVLPRYEVEDRASYRADVTRRAIERNNRARGVVSSEAIQ